MILCCHLQPGPTIREALLLQIPFRGAKRGGRKEKQPGGFAQQRRADNALIKSLARAFRWGRESSPPPQNWRRASASRPPNVIRVLRLTLLAPDIVKTILAEKQGPEVTLARALEPFPLAWEQQPSALGQQKKKGQAAACPNGVV